MNLLKSNTKILKSNGKYVCNFCNYKTTRKNNFNVHLLTLKHHRHVKPDGHLCKVRAQKKKNKFCKFCFRKFQSQSGKWKHEQKCSVKNIQNQLEKEKLETEKMRRKIEKLEVEKIKTENIFLKEKVEILEKHKMPNINTQNNNNCINVNFFLNEKCKNAIPIMDFIRNLQFNLTDINPERPASTIESLSKVITDKLSDMEETERPMHCSDVKRLNFYVKDASGWIKDIDNKKIDKAIGWANMRHQGAWFKRVEDGGLDKTEQDTTYHTMNIAMAKFSDDPNRAKKKIKRAIANVTGLTQVLH